MKGLLPEEYRSLLLSVGSHRSARPLSPVEAGQLFRKSIDAGSSLAECAEAVQFNGTTMVSRFLRLLKLSPDVQHMVDWGQSGSTLSFTAASELSRLAADDQLAAFRAALENRLTTSEVKQLVQIRLRSNKPISECITEVVRLRPQIERRHLIIGAINEDRVAGLLAKLTQSERDALLRDLSTQILPRGISFSGRLGNRRFTMSGDPELAKALAALGDFETLLTDAISKSLKNDRLSS